MTRWLVDWQRLVLLSVCLVLAGSCALPALEKVAAFDDGTAGSVGSSGGKSNGGAGAQSSSGDRAGGGDEGVSGDNAVAGKVNGGGSNAGTGGSATGGSSTGAGGEQAGAGGVDDCVDEPGKVTDLLISNLENSPSLLNPPRTGEWFVFAGGGTISPAVNQFTRSSGGANATSYCARVMGSGSTYAGTGFTLNGKQGGTCVYDASAYSGVSLYYKSSHALRLIFSTKARMPIGEGGSCTNECGNYHGYALPASSAWTKADVTFAFLAQDYGPMEPFKPAELMWISAQVSGEYNPTTNMVDPIVGAFDVSLDEVRFTPL
jgi:hypothetical protein